MQRIFLLRAYGDFVIALQAIAKRDKKIQIVASDHLAPLYHALISTSAIPPLSIEFISLGIQHGQLNFFTNKHLFSRMTWQQLAKLKAYIKANPNQDGTDFIEQDIRRSAFNFIIGHSFQAVVPPDAQVYQAYADWLGLNQDTLKDSTIKDRHVKEVLVIPDARLQKRMINLTLLEKLKSKFLTKEINFKVARFNHTVAASDLIYKNFDQLIQYMLAADFIICTDSLPAHLAYVIKKPHYIFYPKKGMKHFFTPYSIANNTVGHFEETDFRF